MLWKKTQNSKVTSVSKLLRFNRNKNYVNWSNYKQKIEFMNEFYFEQAQLRGKI